MRLFCLPQRPTVSAENTRVKKMKVFEYFVEMPHAQFEVRESFMFQAWQISAAITALLQCV